MYRFTPRFQGNKVRIQSLEYVDQVSKEVFVNFLKKYSITQLKIYFIPISNIVRSKGILECIFHTIVITWTN